jgi:hypothetical protein
MKIEKEQIVWGKWNKDILFFIQWNKNSIQVLTELHIRRFCSLSIWNWIALPMNRSHRGSCFQDLLENHLEDDKKENRRIECSRRKEENSKTKFSYVYIMYLASIFVLRRGRTPSLWWRFVCQCLQPRTVDVRWCPAFGKTFNFFLKELVFASNVMRGNKII